MEEFLKSSMIDGAALLHGLDLVVIDVSPEGEQFEFKVRSKEGAFPKAPQDPSIIELHQAASKVFKEKCPIKVLTRAGRVICCSKHPTTLTSNPSSSSGGMRTTTLLISKQATIVELSRRR